MAVVLRTVEKSHIVFSGIVMESSEKGGLCACFAFPAILDFCCAGHFY
jgi:hypothetical protein